jgi:hypothetical protein
MWCPSSFTALGAPGHHRRGLDFSQSGSFSSGICGLTLSDYFIGELQKIKDAGPGRQPGDFLCWSKESHQRNDRRCAGHEQTARDDVAVDLRRMVIGPVCVGF